MAYSKQTWDTTSYVNPTRMNHIEDGIANAYDSIVVNRIDQNVDVTANTTATTNVNWGNIDRNKVLYSWVWWSNPTSDSPVAITTYYNGTGVGALNQIVHRWSVTQNVKFKICYVLKT